MKAVLISIQPKWCELIASGKKTVEVRKTKPKLETPFKCYIYCTQGDALALPCLNNPKYNIHRVNNGTIKGRQMTADERKQSDHSYANGKVIGEFVCDKIYDITPHFDTPTFPNQYICGWEYGKEFDCLSFEELTTYLSGKDGYGWHISNLVIYDKPKELTDFIIPSKIGCCNEGKCRGCKYFDRGNGFNVEDDCNAHFSTDEYKPLRRPPQSWCYVEEGE